MLCVNIITVGKLKEQYLRDAVSEYSKRLSAFCKLNIIEISEQRISENPSLKEIQNSLYLEGKQMQTLIESKQTYNFAMCIEGKQMSSEELSESFNSIALTGNSTINFIIGSSYGITDEIKTKANYKLSMSKMTFPHQLARVMLLEQIYRGFQILNNGKYHK